MRHALADLTQPGALADGAFAIRPRRFGTRFADPMDRYEAFEIDAPRPAPVVVR